MKKPRSKKPPSPRKPRPKAPTIPHDPEERPATMRAMVKIDAARAQEVDSKLVAASKLVTRLQTQIRLIAQELRDAEAERDHLSQVAESGEEESDVPVRYQVRGGDLCAVRDDEPEKWPDDNSSVVLARRPATPEDRTVPLPFRGGEDRFADLTERAGEPPTSILASANPDLPSPEKPYAVGDTLERVECGEALYTVRIAGGGPAEWILESAEPGCKVPEPEILKSTAELRRDYVRVEPTPEHEPPLAVKKNLEPPVDFSEDPAAADAAADIAREQARTRKPVLEPIFDEVFVEGARKVEELAGPSLVDEPEPVRDRVCTVKGCALAGAETALEECIACGRPTSPMEGCKAQEGGKASPDTAAGIRTLLVERLGARGAARAESEARKACEGVGPDERLIECADIGGVDQRLRKLLVRLLELEPAAKSGAPKARKGGRR